MAYSCPYSSSRPRRRPRRRGPRGSGPKRGRFLRLSTVASHGQERERRSREELKCVAQRARLILDNSAWSDGRAHSQPAHGQNGIKIVSHGRPLLVVGARHVGFRFKQHGRGGG